MASPLPFSSTIDGGPQCTHEPTVRPQQASPPLTSPMVPAIAPRLPRLRDKAFVTPETDDSVPAEACLSKDETPRKVARTVEEGPWIEQTGSSTKTTVRRGGRMFRMAILVHSLSNTRLH